jgi:hypothetical protein
VTKSYFFFLVVANAVEVDFAFAEAFASVV